MITGINGAHWVLYSTDAEADRTFFRDVLGLRSVDAGGGWLIFALPGTELAVHPGDGSFVQRHGDHALLGGLLYFMCDDVKMASAALEGRGVACSPIENADWGDYTLVRLPSGGQIGLYQPHHPRAV
jgi:catechol 2,3-dioxygenase-like lactoylglutathione lyase family enzyme